MRTSKRVVIVGGGLAGGSAARTLREEGFDGRVTLVTAEHHPPYERPPLSKEYVRGESGRAQAYVEPEASWAERNVEVLTDVSATDIRLAERRLELADGASLDFDALLLAPGSAPRTLSVPGGELDGIVTLRTFEDADAIAEGAKRSGRALIVGGGWIASEVAASLRTLGHTVTLALPGESPLEHAIGPDVAAVYRDMHQEHGVTVLPGSRIVRFDGQGSVQRAQLASGGWLEADLVVVAIGVVPRVDLAERAGLSVDDGVIVDGLLRTDDPGIFAAGDVARVPHVSLGRSMRVEHWGSALAQGRHSARAMMGVVDPYDELPYFFSDQYQTGMEFWGDPALPGDLVVRGALEARSFNAFWHQAGRVTAVLNMHVHHEHGHSHGDQVQPAAGHIDSSTVERLLRSPEHVDIHRLGDPDVPLEELPGR